MDAGCGRGGVSELENLAVSGAGLVIRIGEEGMVEVRRPLSISPMISPAPSRFSRSAPSWPSAPSSPPSSPPPHKSAACRLGSSSTISATGSIHRTSASWVTDPTAPRTDDL
jgi:hypothetical protein